MSSGLLGIGVSGLKYNQSALNTTGHNITNAATEGYSRQRVNAEAAMPFQKGPNYFGTGVNVQSVERIVNEYLVRQLRMDTSAFQQLESYVDKISQIDSLLADEENGLLGGLNRFFSALQSASSDPASLPARQLVLTQAQGLSQRFNDIYDSLDHLNQQINSEAKVMVNDLNSFARGIAGINQQLADASGGAEPINDLMDQRDELIRRMSELAEISVSTQPNGMVNIFIGNGQSLVLGTNVSQFQMVSGQTDSARMDVKLVSSTTNILITDDIGGGKLGGLMQFRHEVLDKSFNSVGRVALAFSEAMNHQQHSGLDRNGQYGKDLWVDLGDSSSQWGRVALDKNNAAPGGQRVGVAIVNAAQLTDSDYELRFIGNNGGSYELTRLSDQSVVASGSMQSARPMTISADGFSISINSGTFAQGDRVQIQPTRHAARDMMVESLRADQLAFAAPLLSQHRLGNTGTGNISPVEMLSRMDSAGNILPAFQQEGKLSPPLLVRFTSATTYELLDNSDPTHPKALTPPITNQLFFPGQSNAVFASEPGQQRMVSDGFNAGRIPNNVVSIPPGPAPANAYLAETLNFRYVNPETGSITTFAPLNIAAGSTAQEIASALSSREGISARASTYMELQINDDGAGQALQVSLNGVNLTAVAPPSPVTPDYLAAAINNDASLQASGIRAVSDGVTLKVFSSSGIDFDLQVSGGATDNLVVKGDVGALLFSTTDISNGVDFNTGAPTSFTINIGGGPRTIQLSGVYDDQQSVIDYVQAQINSALNSPSRVRVEAGANGTLHFVTLDTSHNATLAIGGISNDVLGLASAAAAGIVSPADRVTVAGAGVGVANAIAVGGKVSVTLEAGYSMSTNAIGPGNIFSASSEVVSNYTGFTFSLSGNPAAGDEFFIDFNSNGISDNRNALKMLGLQSATLVADEYSLANAYGKLVADIGTLGSQANINRDASQVVLQQTKSLRDSVSAVNLDEEAANLIRYEQGYAACSRVITSAQRMIDALFEAMQ